MSVHNIIAAIVTFNPDLDRLNENVVAVKQQIENIIILDNGSENISGIQALCNKYEVACYPFEENKGIAFALKEAMYIAREKSMDWVLTLDQDSVVQSGLIKNYLKYTSDVSVGAMTCIIHDRNFDRKENFVSELPQNIKVCITSGCLMKVDAYFRTAGYDERLFIDKVDYDICFSLLDKGFSIIRIPFYGLMHEVGSGLPKHFLGRNPVATNHPAWRRYYMVRNSIIVYKKHTKQYPWRVLVSNELKDFLVVLFYENNKLEKTRQSFRGLIDGLKFKV